MGGIKIKQLGQSRTGGRQGISERRLIIRTAYATIGTIL